MDHQYPKGKLNESDEGAISIMSYIRDNRLILDFRKDISWIGLDKAYLRTLIDGLEEHYNNLK